MKLKITRKDNKEMTVKSDNGFGLIIVCQQTTRSEHHSIKKLLESSLNKTSKVDLFYSWNNVSIFIFENDNYSDSMTKQIRDTMRKIIRYAIYNDGVKVTSTLTDLYINVKDDILRVGKKFSMLLTMEKND